jgi:hypothetical protein
VSASVFERVVWLLTPLKISMLNVSIFRLTEFGSVSC